METSDILESLLAGARDRGGLVADRADEAGMPGIFPAQLGDIVQVGLGKVHQINTDLDEIWEDRIVFPAAVEVHRQSQGVCQGKLAGIARLKHLAPAGRRDEQALLRAPVIEKRYRIEWIGGRSPDQLLFEPEHKIGQLFDTLRLFHHISHQGIKAAQEGHGGETAQTQAVPSSGRCAAK
jgi:hypothetical protein